MSKGIAYATTASSSADGYLFGGHDFEGGEIGQGHVKRPVCNCLFQQLLFCIGARLLKGTFEVPGCSRGAVREMVGSGNRSDLAALHQVHGDGQAREVTEPPLHFGVQVLALRHGQMLLRKAMHRLEALDVAK